MEYENKLREKYGILNIASFALVDHTKDKTHTGKFKIKVQFCTPQDGNPYNCLVVEIDKDGQLTKDEDGLPKITRFNSSSILSVCEQDFEENGTKGCDSNSHVGQIPMVKSTTSSHWSVFAQRIPDYDLRYVRNYLQFKTRLEGMELFLEYLERNIKSKEIQCSECFS